MVGNGVSEGISTFSKCCLESDRLTLAIRTQAGARRVEGRRPTLGSRTELDAKNR